MSSSPESERARKVRDAIVGGPRASRSPFRLVLEDGTLAGPFELMTRFPEVGGPLQELGAAIRFDTSLSARVREIAILSIAGESGSTFERTAHEAVARQVGMMDSEIQQLADDTFVSDRSVEVLTANIARRLTASLVTPSELRSVDDRTAAELIVLAGYYRMIAQLLAHFDRDQAAQIAGVDVTEQG
ncbi:carboxymuconolactone decarboxylase family protein [Glaciihabitans sp. UYNi722]|uniref:carboxymuconolactone decarboxylase family protein n=1 Tax=Glaciihabitans sp. UYNi722 TaxID=3156344 RepID=UPI00339554FA